MTSCGRNESPQFSFPPSLLLHGEKYQHKCYCGRRGWVALPNPMEVLAGSIVRTSLRCISSMITTTSGFPRHVCGARVFRCSATGERKRYHFSHRVMLLAGFVERHSIRLFQNSSLLPCQVSQKNEVPFDEKFRFFL